MKSLTPGDVDCRQDLARILISTGDYPGALGHIDAAMELAGKIASKSPKAVELAKWSLNGIELLDPKESYRYEQGFTLELYASPDSQESRDAFVDKREAAFGDESEDKGQ